MILNKSDIFVSILSTNDIIETNMIEKCFEITNNWLVEQEVEEHVLNHIGVIYQNEYYHVIK